MINDDDLKIMKQSNTLCLGDVKKLMHRMKNSMIVGTELETQNLQKENRDKLIQILDPTDNYYAVPDNLVVQVTTDGSLHSNGNAEVIMLGDNASFEELRDKYSFVEEKLRELNFYVDHECGQHLSLLTQKPTRIPSLVFRNYFQLIKLFSPELLFFSGAGINLGVNAEQPIIRLGARQYANWNFNNTTAINKTSQQMIELSKLEAPRGIHSGREGGKYGFFNIYKTKIIPDSDDVGYLFVEFRTPDRQQIPSVTVALTFLIRALFLKAVKLSGSGLFLATNDYWENKRNWLEQIFNHPAKEILKNKELFSSAEYFIDYLKDEFFYLDGEKAFNVMKFLCKNPLWKIRMDLKNSELDEEFETRFKEYYKSKDKQDIIVAGLLELETYIRKNITNDFEKKEVTGTYETIQELLLVGINAKSTEELMDKLAEKCKVTNVTIKKYFDENNIKVEKINDRFVGC
jgi:hypothetical protein